MLTRTEILETVPPILEKLIATDTKRCFLTIVEGKLTFKTYNQGTNSMPRFFSYNSQYHKNGLKSEEWEKLTRNILNYFLKEKPCQQKLFRPEQNQQDQSIPLQTRKKSSC
jgi:hypothetical protein